ncbi:MAG: hypothetical protein GF364_07365, partial [Candidatus Lokiarchaeota archaeon]|nr:hypothetical protein [Candidatus Lokiarchaeota archaeon]
MADLSIVFGQKATTMECLACGDLKKDLELVSNLHVEIIDESDLFNCSNISELRHSFQSINSTRRFIVVGTPETSNIIQLLSEGEFIPITLNSPGKRGGCIYVVGKKLDHSFTQRKVLANNMVVLAGSDPAGAQYMVYDFSSRILGIDPFAYWTDYSPEKIDDYDRLAIESSVIDPPHVPIICYFDNDNDELANMTKPFLEFSFKNWKELINTLVRLRYNAIDLHDHLGRSEFYRWKYYKKLRPNYKPNIDLLNQVIEYGHKKGMKFQVSFYLGWKFKTISDKANKNYEKYKEEWFKTWKYYLESTPIGKCDIFLNRPRDQKWDRRYKGGNYKETALLFNEIFHEMRNIIKDHNPDAIIIADLYSEGMTVYANGFRPKPKEDFILAWPDDGFGHINNVPDELEGYRFGVYVHAGFFLNHVVQDPYPEALYEAMKKSFDKGLNEYCLVNGQTFRHFLLNIEACSRICYDPISFNPDKFYLEWCSRYFGQDYAAEIVKILKLLHEGQSNRLGYVKTIGYAGNGITRLKLMKWLFFLPKSFVLKQFDKIFGIKDNFTKMLEEDEKQLREAFESAKKIEHAIKDQNHFFHDHIILPIKLLLQLKQFTIAIQKAAHDYKNKEHIKKAYKIWRNHTKTRLEGDKNKKWSTW